MSSIYPYQPCSEPGSNSISHFLFGRAGFKLSLSWECVVVFKGSEENGFHEMRELEEWMSCENHDIPHNPHLAFHSAIVRPPRCRLHHISKPMTATKLPLSPIHCVPHQWPSRHVVGVEETMVEKDGRRMKIEREEVS